MLASIGMIGCGRNEAADVGLKEKDEVAYSEHVGEYTEEELKEMSPEALFDLFCAGKIEGESRDFTSVMGEESYSVSAKDFDFDGTDPYTAITVGNPIDVDNDGELEFVLNTELHGDIYFDCKDGKVVQFAQGEYHKYCTNTNYDGAIWIVFYDYTIEGKNSYYMYKLNGDLKVDGATYLFHEDPVVTSEYSFNGEEITEEEYDEHYKELFSEDFGNNDLIEIKEPIGKYSALFTEEIEGEENTYAISYTFNSDGTGIYDGQDTIEFTWDKEFILMNDTKYPYVLNGRSITVEEFTGIKKYFRQ